ncbi:MAG: SpoIID/LytB domain-containing protein [Candidatus Magasanikbacteria bacterium]
MTIFSKSSIINFKRFSFVLFWLIAMFFFALPAEAAPEVVIRDNAYSARYVTQSIPDPIVLQQGETKVVDITFKNVGTATWQTPGNRHISAYSMEPRYRTSKFKASNWVSGGQTGSIKGIIAPGQTGILPLQLTANAESGEYIEKFYLAAENYSWIRGGYFYVKIRVVPKTGVNEQSTVSPEKEKVEEVVSARTYKGKKVGLSRSRVIATGGERIKIVLIYQNTGDAVWKKYALMSGIGSLAAGESVSFADEAWENAVVVAEKSNEVVPSKSFRETFYIRAPEKKGKYLASFAVKADDTVLDEVVTININVTENAPVGYQAPTFSGSAPEAPDTSGGIITPGTPRMAEEPRIRVGLQSSDDIQERALQFVSYEDEYRVFNGEKEVGILGKTKIGLMQYASGVYSFKGEGVSFRTNNFIRLEPVSNSRAVFTLMNVTRPMAWAGSGKFNTYRGAVEYRKGQSDGEMYIVNDLLFEDYVRGIRETGTGAPIEMVKANITAARTYAYRSLGKYPFFDVLANTYDQLYLGHGSEGIGNVGAAVDATRGVMVTYDNEIVTTPYFGNSNGYTKSWKTAWGGTDKPWLQPVKCEYDLRDGKSQYGHGVGMSQRDAAYRAEDGASWVEILKHYYTGVNLEKMY